MIRTYDRAAALVTGGASGIGRALAEELARRGADVVVADLQGALAEEVASAIRRAGGRATAAVVDVRDGAAVERVVADALSRHGRLDYVFNNAGTGVMGQAHHMSAADWELVVDVNLKGVLHVVHAAYPRLVEQGFGHLVNTASVAGLLTPPFLSAYVATKHAVVGLSRSMRVEARRLGVRVSVLCPGAIETPLLTGGVFGRSLYEMSDERKRAWWARVRPVPVGPFVKDALAAVARDEGVIVLPRFQRPLLRMLRLVPGLEERIQERLLARTLAEFPEMQRPAGR